MLDAVIVVCVVAVAVIVILALKKWNKSKPVKDGYSSTDEPKTEG